MSLKAITADLLRAMPLPQPREGSKDERGHVLVIAGSREVPGAALLSGTATLRAGAGKLQIAAVKSTALSLALAVPRPWSSASPRRPTAGSTTPPPRLACC